MGILFYNFLRLRYALLKFGLFDNYFVFEQKFGEKINCRTNFSSLAITDQARTLYITDFLNYPFGSSDAKSPKSNPSFVIEIQIFWHQKEISMSFHSVIAIHTDRKKKLYLKMIFIFASDISNQG